MKKPQLGKKKQTKRQSGASGQLLNRLRPQVRQVFVYIGLFSLFINLLMLTTPIYMLQVYDRVLASGSVPTLLFLTLVVVGMTLAGSLLENVRSKIMVRLGKSLDAEVADTLFSSLFSNQHAETTGKRSTRALSDMNQVRNFLTGPGLTNLFDAPWTPIYLGVIFLFSPTLGLIATFGAIALFIVAVLSDLLTRKEFTKASGTTNFAQSFADYSVQNAETAESMGMVDGLKARWLAIHDSGLSQQVVASERAGILSSVAKFIRPSLQISILGTGAYLALQAAITPGVMIAASIIMSRALAPVEGAIGQWRNIVLARAAYQRLTEILGDIEETENSVALPKPKGQLLIERLVAPAPGSEVPLIKGISFAVAPGDLVGMIGPSGAGKSSLAKLMIGVWRPSSGHVRLDGADVADWPRADLGKHIGYLPQDVALFDGTVAENIARFGPSDPEGVILAANRAGVHELILRLPEGYETKVGKNGSALSGGQRQRIGLARALYGEPALVVLDEPNSNLDGLGEQALLNTLNHLKAQSVTTIIIAHRPSILSMVDKLLVIKEGMIENYGAIGDIMSKVTPNQTQNQTQNQALNQKPNQAQNQTKEAL